MPKNKVFNQESGFCLLFFKSPIQTIFLKCTESGLREKFPDTEFFLVRIFLHSDWIRRFTPYFPVFRVNTEIYSVNLRIQSEYRKIQARKYSVFGHFSCSADHNKEHTGLLQKKCYENYNKNTHGNAHGRVLKK